MQLGGTNESEFRLDGRQAWSCRSHLIFSGGMKAPNRTEAFYHLYRESTTTPSFYHLYPKLTTLGAKSWDHPPHLPKVNSGEFGAAGYERPTHSISFFFEPSHADEYHDEYSGSAKITAHLDHISHCQTASWSNESNIWTYQVSIVNTRRD